MSYKGIAIVPAWTPTCKASVAMRLKNHSMKSKIYGSLTLALRIVNIMPLLYRQVPRSVKVRKFKERVKTAKRLLNVSKGRDLDGYNSSLSI